MRYFVVIFVLLRTYSESFQWKAPCIHRDFSESNHDFVNDNKRRKINKYAIFCRQNLQTLVRRKHSVFLRSVKGCQLLPPWDEEHFISAIKVFDVKICWWNTLTITTKLAIIVPSAIVLSETFEEETYCQIVKGDRRHLRSYHSDHQRINYHPHLLNCETREGHFRSFHLISLYLINIIINYHPHHLNCETRETGGHFRSSDCCKLRLPSGLPVSRFWSSRLEKIICTFSFSLLFCNCAKNCHKNNKNYNNTKTIKKKTSLARSPHLSPLIISTEKGNLFLFFYQQEQNHWQQQQQQQQQKINNKQESSSVLPTSSCLWSSQLEKKICTFSLFLFCWAQHSTSKNKKDKNNKKQRRKFIPSFLLSLAFDQLGKLFLTFLLFLVLKNDNNNNNNKTINLVPSLVARVSHLLTENKSFAPIPFLFIDQMEPHSSCVEPEKGFWVWRQKQKLTRNLKKAIVEHNQQKYLKEKSPNLFYFTSLSFFGSTGTVYNAGYILYIIYGYPR